MKALLEIIKLNADVITASPEPETPAAPCGDDNSSGELCDLD